MKKIIALLLIFVLALSLAACGRDRRKDKNGSIPFQKEEEQTLGVDLSTGEWIGRGGSYTLRSAGLPADKQILHVLLWQGELYYLTMEDDYSRFVLCRGDKELYAMKNFPQAAAVSERGFWIMVNDYYENDNHYICTLVSPAGQVLDSLNYSECCGNQSFPFGLVSAGGNLYIVTADEELIVLSEEGEPEASFEILFDDYLVKGNDEQLYMVRPTDSGNELYRLNFSSDTAELLFSCGPGQVQQGGEEHFMLLSNRDGLYSLDCAGGTQPIVIWAECGLSVNGLQNVQPMPGGRFLCATASGWNLLDLIDPTDIKPRTRLTLAHTDPGSFERAAELFNSVSEDYYVDLIDYTDGGELDPEAAPMHLNTEIISGKLPDMLGLDTISPYLFISKGLLLDMTELFEQDENISLSDIAVLNAMDNYGGVYYMGNSFYFETIVGRFADFGERYGWTIDEYLTIDSAQGPSTETLYNLTRDSFVNNVVCRYAKTAMDWEKGACHFDSPAFITLLEAAARMRETPEDPENMDFTPGPVRVGSGTLVGALQFVTNVSTLSQAQQAAGCKLSYIGWPTADGSCGSDLTVRSRVGIIAQGAHIKGCWEFIKFMLMTTSSSLPVYRPSLEAKIEQAKNSEETSERISDEDAQRFLTLISAMEEDQFMDRTIVNIIREECAAMFAGDKTAAETARLIQSRASLYVAEQA